MSSFEKPIADQVLEEAALVFTRVCDTHPVNHTDTLALPNQTYLDTFSDGLDHLLEVAEAIDPVDPWAVARSGLRRTGSGLQKTRLFSPAMPIQAQVMKDLQTRKAVFAELDRDWLKYS